MFAQSSLLLLSTALLRSVLVSADAASLCPARAEGACYAVTVPKTTAGGSSKDIYFQISAPSSLQWIGFGQSNDGQMAGANVFVLYQSADGKNVTLSKRHASGNYQPTVDSSIDATLLEGSGIIGGKMVANVRCSTCLSWDGGSISPTGTDTKWIWSVRKGTPIMSDDAGYNIVQHNFYGDFNFDLTKAVDATGSQNPLYAASQHTGSSNSTTAGSGAGASTGATEGTSSATPSKSYSIAHGVLMSAAFLIIMPAGALLKRLGFSKRSAMVSNPTSANNRFRSLPHAIVELFAVTEITVGLGLGLYVANKKDLLRDRAHTALGLVIFSFVILQALGGMATYCK